MAPYPNSFYKAVVFAMIFGSTASAATQITVRSRVEMNGPVVRLGDVAEIVCADRQEARRLAALPLMPAPAPGTQRFLRKREIQDLLAAHGAALNEMRIEGAEQATVVGFEAKGVAAAAPMNRHAAILAGHTATRINPNSESILRATHGPEFRDEVRDIVTAYLKSKTDVNDEWHVTCEVADRHLAVLATATSPLVCQGGKPPWTGRQQFVITSSTKGGAIQVPVYAEVSPPPMPVVVAAQPIARGDVFTAANLELRSVEHGSKSSKRVSIDAVEKLIGLEARQAIQAGEVIFTDRVQSPVLVKRGDLISVTSQGSGIRVRTTARARQDGAQGELVQLESLETRERFDARVVGHRQAAIVAITTSSVNVPTEQIETAKRVR